jgi:hypothetical protein
MAGTSPTSDPPHRPGYQRRPPAGRGRWWVLLAIVVAAGVLGREAVVSLFQSAPPASTRPVAVQLPPVPSAPATGPSVEILRQQALRRTQPGLDWADAETRRSATEHLKAIDAFFGEVKGRTPRFAERILGWSSKWRLVSDKLPFTRTDRHAQFLDKTFREELFSPEQLTQTVDAVVRNYTDSVAGVENRMLVRVRADVGDLEPAALPAFADEAKLRVAFDDAMRVALDRTRADLRADVTREAVSLVAGEVLTMVAVRLGVSGGILAAGAGTSWATFGVGLVVAVIVDQIVSWVWDWWRDPQGDVSRKMNDKLDEIRRLIVEGDGAAPGLRQRLDELAANRDKLRRAAMVEMIEGPRPTTRETK